MLEIIGSIISYVFVALLIGFFVFIATITTYYLTYDFWWKLRWRLQRRKSEHIKAISVSLSTINENSLKRITGELSRRLRIRLSDEMHMLKTITMSTDENGDCYITAWYREKRSEHVGEDYYKSYNNPLSDWQL